MTAYKTKVIITLKDGVTYMADDVIELENARAEAINNNLESAFPTLSPILVPANGAEVKVEDDTPGDIDKNGDGKLTKEELKATLDAKGIEYPAKATNEQLKALLDA